VADRSRVRRRSAAAILPAVVLASINLARPVTTAGADPAATTDAAGAPAAPAAAPRPDRPAAIIRLIQAGIFELGQGDSSAALGLELRFDRRSTAPAPARRCRFDPRLGILATSNGAVYLHGGVGVAVRLPRRYDLAAGLEVGLYENRQDVDLGGPVEFRTSFEMTRRLANGRRAGVVFHHLSNASRYERNPGVNSLLALWSF